MLSGSGGAILSENTFLLITNNTILYNSAEIGGGIRFYGLNSSLIDEGENIISNNSASLYSNNIGSFPCKMKIKYTP